MKVFKKNLKNKIDNNNQQIGNQNDLVTHSKDVPTTNEKSKSNLPHPSIKKSVFETPKNKPAKKKISLNLLDTIKIRAS